MHPEVRVAQSGDEVRCHGPLLSLRARRPSHQRPKPVKNTETITWQTNTDLEGEAWALARASVLTAPMVLSLLGQTPMPKEYESRVSPVGKQE